MPLDERANGQTDLLWTYVPAVSAAIWVVFCWGGSTWRENFPRARYLVAIGGHGGCSKVSFAFSVSLAAKSA